MINTFFLTVIYYIKSPLAIKVVLGTRLARFSRWSKHGSAGSQPTKAKQFAFSHHHAKENPQTSCGFFWWRWGVANPRPVKIS